ncbi:MAG: dihydropteroate synthase [Bacteroidota bacterium]
MLKSRVEDTTIYSKNSIRVGEKLLDLSKPKVMGIINCTPDSFYKGSRFESLKAVIQEVETQINHGVSIVDIGGNSTRPGSKKCSAEEEILRTIPIIEAIRKEFPELIISIDTFRGKVAKDAIEVGANIINDISGFSMDSEMLETLKRYSVPYILTHIKGNPETMQNFTQYDNIFKEISFYFSEKINVLKQIGIKDILLDPGFGFAKTMEQNYELLNRLEDFTFLNHPIIVGFSRKSMIYKKLNITEEEALNGTTVLNTLALLKGAKIIRVHDVSEATQIIGLLDY